MRTTELTLDVGEVVRIGGYLCTVVETDDGEVAVKVEAETPPGEFVPDPRTPDSPR